jgi:hypothetical protein
MEKFLFMIPLFFQVVLLDSASKAGIRLVIPSLSTPVGGLIAGFVMSRWGILGHLVRLGCFLMMLGNGLVASLQYQDSTWKYIAYLFPANLGQGIVYPSILFTNIAFFEQSGRSFSKKLEHGLRENWQSTEQAVSTSMVYLFRSMGTVWGVAAASAIIQNILTTRLPNALSEIPDKEKVIFLSFPFAIIWRNSADHILWNKIIDEIRHSVSILRDLDPEVQDIARRVYFEALRVTFLASTGWAAVALISAFFAKGQRLDRK